MNVTASLLPTTNLSSDNHLLTDFEFFDYPLAPSWVSTTDVQSSPLDVEVQLDSFTTDTILQQPQLPQEFIQNPLNALLTPQQPPQPPQPQQQPLPPPQPQPIFHHQIPDFPQPPPYTPSDTTSASSQRHSTASTLPATPLLEDTRAPPLPTPVLPLRPAIGRVQKQTRRYTAPKSSRYCHLCARHQRSVSMVPCGNVEVGLCQKSVCSKCIDMYHLQVTGPSWACPHCQNKCPARAKCFAYDRQTARRREKTMRAKLNSLKAKTLQQQQPFPQ